MLKKKISKEFELKEFNAKAEVTAYIHKISYNVMQEKKKRTLSFLKSVKKNDREAMMDAFNSGNIGKILGSIEDLDSISRFWNDAAESVKLCLRDTLVIKITDEDGVSEIFEDDKAWNNEECPLTKEMIDWLGEKCRESNPELFNPSGFEKKK